MSAKIKEEVFQRIGDRLLTLREAAEALRLSTRTVREYFQRGEMDGRLIGGRWRFRRVDLDPFLKMPPGMAFCAKRQQRRLDGEATKRDAMADSSRLALMVRLRQPCQYGPSSAFSAILVTFPT